MKDEKLLKQSRERFAKANDYWSDIFSQYSDCMSFKHGDQWEDTEKKGRDEDQRPSLVFNRIAGHISHLVGEQRQNRPSIKVIPVEGSDDETADVFSGVIRAIEAVSDAEEAYDLGYECALSGGIGAFRVNIDYSDDDTFHQDIRIEAIPNPLTVMIDPMSKKSSGADAKWAFVSEKMTREAFKAKFPKANVPSADDGNEWKLWVDKDEVRVAEYWYHKPVQKTLLLMSDGTTLDADELMKDEELAQATAGLTVVHERKVDAHKVCKAIIAANQILEKVEWVGRYIPIITVFGRMEWVDGKRVLSSIIKNAKDPQRMLNYLRSQEAETLALAPKAPWVVTAEMIEGYEKEWSDASVKNSAVLTVNGTQDGMPQRQPPVSIQTGYEAAAAQMIDEIKAATGQYDASIGAQSNETSGRAIMARQRQGETSTFEYMDNLTRSITQAGRVIVDLMPKVYSYQRIVRVLGEDGDSKEVTLNEQKQDDETGEIVKFNDVTAGKYDVRVTTGASYATQRVESADAMMQFMQAVPGSAQVISDLVARNMDWVGSEQIADRLKAMLPPGLDNQDEQSPEVMQMQQQLQQAQQMIQQLQQELGDQQHKMAVEVGTMGIKEYEAETKRLAQLKDSPQMQAYIQNIVMQTIQDMQQQQFGNMQQPQEVQPQQGA